MKRLLLILLISAPFYLSAQSQYTIKLALEGPSLSEQPNERLHSKRQQLLTAHYDQVPADAIDQVTVALVSPDGKVLEKHTAWLTQGKTLLSIDGSEQLSFETVTSGAQFVIQHSNHLPLATKPITDQEASVIDFTSPESLQGKAYILENGKAYAIAGNLGDMHYERSAYINAMDLFFMRSALVAQELKPKSGAYNTADVNLDGKVDQLDAQIVQKNSDTLHAADAPSIR